MAWTVPQYSRARVDRAGAQLKGDEVALPLLLEIIEDWRTAHNYPLHIFQDALRKRAPKVDKGCLVAQRLKRMQSILRKLHQIPDMRLSAMQDIGGCRAIVTTNDHVGELVQRYLESNSKHKLLKINDYIKQPKSSGYRGVHLVFAFHSDNVETFNKLRLEIQVRTFNQHAWATAVETVETLVNQALKASRGSAEWLRFFALMGAAMAAMERTNPVPGTPDKWSDLKQELRHYVTKLDVESLLFAYGATLNQHKTRLAGAEYFLLVLDPAAKSIQISGFKRGELVEASAKYAEIENQITGTDKNAVLVSVDSINALNRAYPNYFLDTHNFITLLREAIK